MASGVTSYTKSRKIHLTREKLFYFINQFIKRNKIKVKHDKLKKILELNDEKNLFNLPYSMGNFEIYKMETFKSKKFKKFILSINRFGGQYKYRWADYDITNLFLYIHFKDPILSFNFSKSILKSSHPDAKRIIDKSSLLEKIYFYITKRIKRFYYVRIKKI